MGEYLTYKLNILLGVARLSGLEIRKLTLSSEQLAALKGERSASEAYVPRDRIEFGPTVIE